MRLEEQKKKAAELKLQRKAQEKDRWWSGAELFASTRTTDSSVNFCINDELVDKKQTELQRYSNDYSRWDQWTPQDPATLAEVYQISRTVNKKIFLSW